MEVKNAENKKTIFQVNFFHFPQVIYNVRSFILHNNRLTCGACHLFGENTMKDSTLIQKVHSGDKEAAGIIIERYYADIFRFCRYMVQTEEDAVYLKNLLKALSQEIREVIILRIYEEMKFKDIAKMMGCSVSTTKSRFRLGVDQLKRLMENDDEK